MDNNELTMLKEEGATRSFRCECCCNVFRRMPDEGDNQIYRCNACGHEYVGKPVVRCEEESMINMAARDCRSNGNPVVKEVSCIRDLDILHHSVFCLRGDVDNLREELRMVVYEVPMSPDGAPDHGEDGIDDIMRRIGSVLADTNSIRDSVEEVRNVVRKLGLREYDENATIGVSS